MQLPIDVKALIDEATNIKEAQNTPLSVSVYIDEKAPADLAARVRNVFASQLPSVRMTVSYLDSSFTPHPGDDLAIIAAGTSLSIGAAAAAIRAHRRRGRACRSRGRPRISRDARRRSGAVRPRRRVG